MSRISTETVKEAVYKLCFDANTCLSFDVYSKIFSAYEKAESETTKDILRAVLQNAKIAYETKKPLCQDTGQVIVFLKIGQNVQLYGEFIETAINSAVEKCYTENYFRKSIVKNALFDRSNTKTNTPAIIYTEYTDNDELEIGVIIKGGGSENKTKLEMLLPVLSEKEVAEKCADLILSAAADACPPMFIGLCIGGTADKASITSKKVFISKNFDDKEIRFAEKVKECVNLKAPKHFSNSYLLDVKAKILPVHIACMPVCVSINCHSDRVSSCIIKNNQIQYEHKAPVFLEFEYPKNNIKEVFANDISAVRTLKKGEEILLTGEIYTARDMAHKRLSELIKKSEKLPFDIKDKIIFYAGPCPNKPDEATGSIGPTTASRMDKYAVDFYNGGLLASIGKGGRGTEVEQAVLKNNAKYFSVTGGIAALLSEKVKSSQITAFEDLGTEAVYKLYVEKFPLKVEIG